MAIKYKPIPARRTVGDEERWFDLLSHYSVDLNSYTVSVDWPSIAANSTSALAVAVPGIKVGDLFINVSPSATLSTGVGVSHGYISSDGFVTVTLSNCTGTAKDPAAANFTFIWIKNTKV